jgi:hypothetical protein
MNTYKNLQIVWSQIFTDEQIFVYSWSNLNIYWFIGIQIQWNQTKMKSYSVTFDYLQYSVTNSMSDNEGNLKICTIT